MINKIKAEIERLWKKTEDRDGSAYQESYLIGAQHTLITLKDFIESLEKEQKSNEGSKMVLSDATEKLWQSIPHRTHAIYDRIKAYGLFCYEQGRKHTTCLESQGLDEVAEEQWAAMEYASNTARESTSVRDWCTDDIVNAFKAGVKFQAEQGYSREAKVKEDAGGYPYIDEIELYDYDNDKPLAKKGDKVRIQITKL